MHGASRSPISAQSSALPTAPTAPVAGPGGAAKAPPDAAVATSNALHHPGEVTRLLAVIGGDSPEARQRLLDVVYEELHRLADRRLNGDPAHWIVRTTSMVHEAYMRLVGSAEVHWNSRAHFFGAAAEAMRRILVERIRAARSLKRGGGHEFVALDEANIAAPAVNGEAHALDILALNLALERLEQLDARKAEVVKLRFFAGLDMQQAALALDVSERTVQREWEAARIWLFREMNRA
jgi:RNA polymerase sigma factor (TIGR02999 family)